MENNTLALSPVYHVGDLESERPDVYYSQEGGELSISKHPDAWRSISSSVAGTTYTLTRDSPKFFEASTASPRDSVLNWCTSNDYVNRTNAWKLSWDNPEYGTQEYTILYDYNTALIQSKQPHRRNSKITEIQTVELASEGRKYVSSALTKPPSEFSPLDIQPLLPIWYASHELSVDGVWWPEELAPAKYSAPRGALFQDAIPEWTISSNR
jgi:hypothetical protein